MILLYNSDEMSVKDFVYFNFSPEEPEQGTADEKDDIIFPDFEDDEDFEINVQSQKDDEPEPTVMADVEAAKHAALEEERKRRAEFEKEAERMLSSAKAQADEILKKAESEAVDIKEKAHSEGLDKGYTDGFNVAYEKNKAKLEEETVKFLLELRDMVNEYRDFNDRLVAQNIDELKDVTVSIAEKVVQVSLKTSGEIIKKMIVSSTEKMRYKEWARIYIARSDSSLLIEGNTDLLRSIAHVSENIKIIAMDDAAPGTCIIELPDQVIDASASTQIENIKGALKGVNISGGN